MQLWGGKARLEAKIKEQQETIQNLRVVILREQKRGAELHNKVGKLEEVLRLNKRFVMRKARQVCKTRDKEGAKVLALMIRSLQKKHSWSNYNSKLERELYELGQDSGLYKEMIDYINLDREELLNTQDDIEKHLKALAILIGEEIN